MNLSDYGRSRIEGYEGYHDALPDGSCRAYQRTYHGHLDKPTIGFGCTEGVKMGMVWTRAEADAAFAKELAKFESAVTRLVTVDINQNEFDALVSLAYNIGLGGVDKNGKSVPGFSNSTLLKLLNKGDRAGAAKQFARWNRAGGGVVNGLVQRRASEASLFQKPTAPEATPEMPQMVTASPDPPSRKTVAAIVATATSGVASVMPADPIGTAESIVSTGQRVKGVSEQGVGLYGWLAHGVPVSVLAAVAGCAGLYWVLCHWLPKRIGGAS